MAGSDYQVIKLAVMGEVKTPVPARSSSTASTRSWCSTRWARSTSASIARIQLQAAARRGWRRWTTASRSSDAALAELAKAGFDPVYGARPLKRAIQSEIENPLAKAILEGRFAPKDTIRADYRGGEDDVREVAGKSSRVSGRRIRRRMTASAHPP